MISLKVGSWKLTDLINEPFTHEFQTFLDSIESGVKEFEMKRKDLRSDISTKEFEDLIHLIEELYEKVSVVQGYTHLQYYANTSSNEAAALLTMTEKIASDIANRILFFDLWFKKDIKNIEKYIKFYENNITLNNCRIKKNI